VRKWSNEARWAERRWNVESLKEKNVTGDLCSLQGSGHAGDSRGRKGGEPDMHRGKPKSCKHRRGSSAVEILFGISS